ncbi:hypothetical protein CHS0354_035308 [Potamilus streckersoni]|uniref:Flagellin N-terminal domain-containing protein n=1 Tax=Potamilus streckersoni TaxID=2493646 RepID=A0AAE0S2J6_9BIVA|nr:hypothetical protein CHS0354_035308 [Potamilus streckersoni]
MHKLTKLTGDISSGDSIRHTKHNPTRKEISEQLEYSRQSVYQAFENANNTEQVINSAEAGIQDIESLLTGIKQTAIRASNEGANNPAETEAMQIEIEKSIEQIRRIAEFSDYAGKPLLKGTQEVKFWSVSPYFTVVGVEAGHQIEITADAEQAKILSRQTLQKITGSVSISVYMNGKSITHTHNAGEDPGILIDQFNNSFKAQTVPLTASVDEDGRLSFVSQEYGNDIEFKVSADNSAFWGGDSEIITATGKDITGKINGEDAPGKGRIMYAKPGTPEDGLEVLFNGSVNKDEPPDYPLTGAVGIQNAALGFQLGTSTDAHIKFNFKNFIPEALGHHTENPKGFETLADIKVTDFDSAQSSLLVIEKAIGEVALKRAEMGAFKRHIVDTSASQSLKRMKMTHAPTAQYAIPTTP